jgi:replicative DNA helicase
MVGVDYLQLVPGTKESRQESIADVSRGLKMLAMELQCTVVALAQLNRELERRDNKRPILSDLRDSGAIEQDADVVLFTFRQHVYDDHHPASDAELIVGKNRNGSPGTIPLHWEPKTMTFSDSPHLTRPE